MDRHEAQTKGDQTMQKRLTSRLCRTSKLQDELASELAATPCGWEDYTFAGKWWGPGDNATRFYFYESARIYKDGKPVRGVAAWLQFDDPATLEGCSLQVKAPKQWYRSLLAEWHAEAVAIAVGMFDPEEAARLRAELAEARDAGDQIGDLI